MVVDVETVGLDSMVVSQGALGLLRRKTSILYGMSPETIFVIFDFNERFVSLDVVQSINVVLDASKKVRDPGVIARDGSSLLVASDADQKFMVVGSRGSSRVVRLLGLVALSSKWAKPNLRQVWWTLMFRGAGDLRWC